MSIPAEIRAVEQPKNTAIMAYGKNRDLYAAKQRVGCRYDKGRRLPVTGSTIGHIVGMKYVPIPAEPDPCSFGSAPELKEWDILNAKPSPEMMALAQGMADALRLEEEDKRRTTFERDSLKWRTYH